MTSSPMGHTPFNPIVVLNTINHHVKAFHENWKCVLLNKFYSLSYRGTRLSNSSALKIIMSVKFYFKINFIKILPKNMTQGVDIRALFQTIKLKYLSERNIKTWNITS